jgi:hypothetical protein
MTLIKSSFISFILLLLTACGGGGGSSSPSSKAPVPKTLSLSNDNAPSHLLEDETTTFTISLSGIEGKLIPTVTSDSLPTGSTLSAEANGSQVTVTAILEDVAYHEAPVEITVSIKDERTTADQTVTWKKTLLLDNTTGTAAYNKSVAMKDAAVEFVNLTPEFNLLERISMLAELTNNQGKTTSFESLVAELDQIINNEQYKEALDAAIVVLGENEVKYLAGEVADSTLEYINTDLMEVIDSYAQGAYNVIIQATNHTMGVMPAYEYNTPYLSDDGKTFSSFIGNEMLGEFIDGIWVFSDEYKYLEAIVYSELNTCNAE